GPAVAARRHRLVPGLLPGPRSVRRGGQRRNWWLVVAPGPDHRPARGRRARDGGGHRADPAESSARAWPVSRPLTILALLVGFTAAVLARVAVGGHGVAGSATAGLVFAGCLVALTVAARSGVGPA